MTTQLDKPVSKTVTISQVEIFAITDRGGDRTVTADISIENFGSRTVTLWSGDDYDIIGQWTDDDAVKRTKEIVATLIDNQ